MGAVLILFLGSSNSLAIVQTVVTVPMACGIGALIALDRAMPAGTASPARCLGWGSFGETGVFFALGRLAR